MLRKTLAVLTALFLLFGACAEITLEDRRNAGSSERLLDNVCLMVVFVSTPRHPWTDQDFDDFSNTVYHAISALDAEAERWNVNLHTSWMYYQCSLDTEVGDYSNASTDWYEDLMQNYFYKEDMRGLHDYLESKFGYDDTPFVFVFNSEGRPYSYSHQGNSWDDEFSVVFAQGIYTQDYAIIHELLHLYGAIDLYDLENEGIQEITDRYYPQAVMRDSNCIEVDGITAYQIGWRSRMSDYAQEFWNKIRYKR